MSDLAVALKDLEDTIHMQRPGLVPHQQPVAVTAVQGLEHLLWMCQTIRVFVAEGRREKAMRWLGFVQGALWAKALVSIDHLKAVMRADGDL